MKAFIAFDTIVDPEHPLAVDNGGLKAYLGKTPFVHTALPDAGFLKVFLFLLGTLPNGEKRLMFSSAQIEYIQYWLYAMELTREPIALPSSECLIQERDLQHVSSVIYKSGQEFKKAQKVRFHNPRKNNGG